VRTAKKSIQDEFDVTDHHGVEVDFSKYTPDKYLLSHATIVGGVEPAKENKDWIEPYHSRWVNDNGNAWFNQVLLESYPSFIMAENYLEHIQIKGLSKGKILDAVAWVVREIVPGRKESIPTIFVDILVATHKRRHPLLTEKILSGELNTLSMGCEISHSQCSRCGKIFPEGSEQCTHLEDQLGGSFNSGGQQYRIAEMCGVRGQVGSNVFIEASWVGVPAFSWATRHSTLKLGEKWLGRPLRAFVPKDRLTSAAKD